MNEFSAMATLEELAAKGKLWLEAHGCLILNEKLELSCGPATLYPSPVPKAGVEELAALQPYFNKLVDAVSRDHEFLCDIFEKYARKDDFSSCSV